MSFTMIKAAQARIALGNQITVVEHVAKILGESVIDVKKSIFSENFDDSKYQITPEDYSNWLAAIVDMAAEEGISVSRKNAFMQYAMDVILDNDPKFDMLGGDTEELKGQVANTLWQTFKASKAHGAVADNVNGVIQQAREEEEAFAAISSEAKAMEEEEFGHGQHVEVNVRGKWYPCMVVKHGMYNIYVVRVKAGGRTVDIKAPRDALRPAEFDDEQQSGFAQAFDAAKGATEEEETTSCPYKAGTLRAALWHNYNTKPPKTIVKRVAEEEQEAISVDDFDPEATSDETVDDMADRIVGDVGDVRIDDVDDEVPDDSAIGELEARIAELEAQLDDLSSQVQSDDKSEGGGEDSGELDIDYDSLGNDRPGAAGVIGVSVPATTKEEEEKGDMFRQAITAPREKLSAAVKSIEDEGATAWKGMQLPRNPHPKKSQAYNAWEKGMKNAAKEALGLKDKPVVPNKPARKK